MAGLFQTIRSANNAMPVGTRSHAKRGPTLAKIGLSATGNYPKRLEVPPRPVIIARLKMIYGDDEVPENQRADVAWIKIAGSRSVVWAQDRFANALYRFDHG